MVVERNLAKGGESRHDLAVRLSLESLGVETRSGGLLPANSRLGASCDWSRERFTMMRD